MQNRQANGMSKSAITAILATAGIGGMWLASLLDKNPAPVEGTNAPVTLGREIADLFQGPTVIKNYSDGERDVVPLVEGAATMVVFVNKKNPEVIGFAHSNSINSDTVLFEGARKTFDGNGVRKTFDDNFVPDFLAKQNIKDWHVVGLNLDPVLETKLQGENYNGLTMPMNFRPWSTPGAMISNDLCQIHAGHSLGDYSVTTKSGLRFRVSPLFDEGVVLSQADNPWINIFTGEKKMSPKQTASLQP